MTKIREVIQSGRLTAYLTESAVIIGQSVIGAYTLDEGGGSIVDRFTCSVPGINLCYFGGVTYQIIGGSCLIASSFTPAICGPLAWYIAGLGYGFKKIENHIVDKTNLVNPAPSVTKVV